MGVCLPNLRSAAARLPKAPFGQAIEPGISQSWWNQVHGQRALTAAVDGLPQLLLIGIVIQPHAPPPPPIIIHEYDPPDDGMD
jgi:hypothetical protein